MKTNLKLGLIALACAFTLSAPACADNDKPISTSQLPAAAQQTLKKHFAGHKVALAKMESGLLEKSYDVIFTNGGKIEFNRRGEWTEISCKAADGGVPQALMPSQIRQYVKQHYPSARILAIERDKEYEVELTGRVELTFNASFQLIDIDM